MIPIQGVSDEQETSQVAASALTAPSRALREILSACSLGHVLRDVFQRGRLQSAAEFLLLPAETVTNLNFSLLIQTHRLFTF